MSESADQLSAEHERLLQLVEEGTDEDYAVSQVQAFLDQLSKAGTTVGDPRQRSRLRGLIRFWGSYIYDKIGAFPELQLLPAMKAKAEGETDQLEKAEQRHLSKRIGPYEIVDEIGKGGFSTVYKALDTSTEELVALKVLQDEQFQRSRTFRDQLIQREQLVAGLDHPNIVPIYSIAEYDGLSCIAMKLVEGGSLADRLADWYWRPSIRTILDMTAQTCEGLAYLHDRQIVHRDIKPANLLLDLADHVYLTDFGIYKVLESAFKGMIVGTPEYLAPEAILDPEEVDGRADLYSLGIILFQLLAGEVPFKADSPNELMHLQINKPVPRISGLPDGISELIEQCLCKDAEDRFQTAEKLKEAIDALLLSLPEETLSDVPALWTAAPAQREKPHDTQPLAPMPVDASTSDERKLRYEARKLTQKADGGVFGEACPNCGTPLPPNSLFCDGCGFSCSFSQPSSGDSVAPTPPVPPPAPLRAAALPGSFHDSDTVVLEKGQRSHQTGLIAILVARSGLSAESHFLVRKEITSIGRGLYNGIMIEEPSVSRHHALLVYERQEGKQGVFTLFDLGSSNGTIVNEGSPRVKWRLKHNDLITFGRVALIFKRLDDDPKPKPGQEDGKPPTSQSAAD